MKIMVIDGNSILNRAFYGIRLLSNHEGLFTNAIYGFLSTYFRLDEEEAPDHTIVCFDRREKTFRHLKFDTYKATRKGMPDELAVQLPVIKEVLDAMGIIRCELAGYEADDLLGTISRRAAEQGDACVIVTGDRDSLQLVRENVTVRLVSTRMGQTTYKSYTPESFQEEYGFPPLRLIDLKALMGDSSDNISGVPGIGEKTALGLIRQFGSLDGVYEHIDDPFIKKGQRQKLNDGVQAARDSFWLATIDQNVPLELDLSHLPMQFLDEGALYALLTRLEFKGFIKRLGLSAEELVPEMAAEAETERCVDCETAFALLRTLADAPFVAATVSRNLSAVCLLSEGTAHVLLEQDFQGEEWPEILRRLFSGKIKLVLHDAKELLTALLRRGGQPEGVAFDTCLGAYLLNPAEGGYALDRIALSYLNQELPEPVFHGEDAFSPLGGAEDAISAMVRCTGAVEALYHKIEPQLEQDGMHKLYYEVELPLMGVLAEMEAVGAGIDPEQLTAFGQGLEIEIEQLVKDIYAEAGTEFNINSPKQLGKVLFEDLHLKGSKKTKSGYSTSADVLEGLRAEYPIVDRILEYRQLSKLKSTYVEGLLKVIYPEDGRLHTHFQQTVTATGRLSSTEPNLQNIPVRTERGREMRRMFVAKDTGHVLVDADYSQIELRVLAHIANDDAMTEAFRHGQDIHATTAAKVYGVPLEEVTSQMRSSCKAVNFGIVYGISDFSLAQDIGVTKKEAAAFIQSYLETYPGVARYMEEIKASAREKGYVETLFGRRRYLPELKSKQFNVRAFGERVAMNTPIQGTAADIIKIAMVRVRDRLRAEGLSSRLTLQVHDELILESPKEEAARAEALLREEMEHAFEMRVPLVAEAHSGYDWYTAKG